MKAMKKVYEAYGKEKREHMELNNDYKAFGRERLDREGTYKLGPEDLVLIRRTKSLSEEDLQKSELTINGIVPKNNSDDIFVIQFLNKYTKLKQIILMTPEKYEKMKSKLKGLTVRLYEGDDDLAIEMIFANTDAIYVYQDENGIIYDTKNHVDSIHFLEAFADFLEENKEKISVGEIFKTSDNTTIKMINQYSDFSKAITGLTQEKEGDVELDDMYASTDIGKLRENQEDAFLLIKDKDNPKFKMMVVADGMGGPSSGEYASNAIISELKRWFENLSDEQKEKAYNDSVKNILEDLLEEIQLKVQVKVETDTWEVGGSTLVCAIIGKNDTLISNVGDSRAYITQKGKLVQISREDSVAHENYLKRNINNKEAERFDEESNFITQHIGMRRNELNEPFSKIIDNKEYEMLLLFTDGVTDCLSEEDIAVVCKNTDKKELTKKIVEKALRNDSMLPDELSEEKGMDFYIPGGKDNATAIAYIPKKEEDGR